jgi:hypothetical protein
MNVNALSNASYSYLNSLLGNALNRNSATSNNASSSIDPSSLTMPQDKNQLSPMGRLMSTLQQLQQQNPSQYQQVTQQIAQNLQSAAQTAQSQGDTTKANQLNQLAADFKNASSSGQLPSAKDLAQAMGGHHHHHHFGTGSSGSSQNVNQLLSAFQANSTQSDSQDPMSIIWNTLSSSTGGGTSN